MAKIVMAQPVAEGDTILVEGYQDPLLVKSAVEAVATVGGNTGKRYLLVTCYGHGDRNITFVQKNCFEGRGFLDSRSAVIVHRKGTIDTRFGETGEKMFAVMCTDYVDSDDERTSLVGLNRTREGAVRRIGVKIAMDRLIKNDDPVFVDPQDEMTWYVGETRYWIANQFVGD